jgi:hypothetical protein
MEPVMKKLFLTDHIAWGVFLGILLSAATYGLFTLILGSFEAGQRLVADPRNLLLVSFAPNLILMRMYFVGFRREKTGIGILVLTFAGVLFAFFVFR